MLLSAKSSWLVPDVLPKVWASLNGVLLKGVEISTISTVEKDDVPPKGLALVAADSTIGDDDGSVLIRVPERFVISLDRIAQLSNEDEKLQAILHACTDLIENKPRVAILLFLLHQATIANPGVSADIGRQTDFIDYIKSLPIPRLPTLFTPDELKLFTGTNLYFATIAKKESLEEEFEQIKVSTLSIPWLAPIWWGGVENSIEDAEPSNSLVELKDWIVLDAMYRSRALGLPGRPGGAMVPVIDIANHSNAANTRYEVLDDGGDVALLLMDRRASVGTEYCISYQDGDSPYEMLYSYGFLPFGISSEAYTVLVINIPTDDPLGPAKSALAAMQDIPHAVRIFEDKSEGGTHAIKWSCDFVWLVLLNEEDGLQFGVSETDEGKRLSATWKGEEFGIKDLPGLLARDKRRDLYRLRAVVMVLESVQFHGERLMQSGCEPGTAQGSDLLGVAAKVKAMELEILAKAMRALEEERDSLVPLAMQFISGPG